MTESYSADPAAPPVVQLADPVTSDDGRSDDGSDAPAIVAVCISSDAGDDLEACLGSLADQDYPNLSILVIDAGNESPIAERVAAAAPSAYLHRLQSDPGFSAAANQAATLVQDAAFLLFCTDAVVLEPHTTTALAEEMFRSNAGIVTPKFVEWDDPRRLMSVGMGADHYGVKVGLIEPREFDQEQHDGVRDVFVAPTGVQLIRRDLFTSLGGFDPSLGSENEDLDLCWRAHVAGARIVVNPSTTVRIRPVEPDSQPSRQMIKNRLRSLLVTSSRWTLVRALPMAVLLIVAEAVGLLFSGKRARAVGALGVIPATISDIKDIRTRRAKLEQLRQVPDAEVRALQVGGSARVADYARSRFGASQDRLAGLVGSVRDNLSGDELTAQRVAALGAMLLGALFLFGSRSLIGAGIVPVGQIPQLPGSGTLLGEWWSGWRSAGSGGVHAAPVLFFVLGVLRIVFFWATGLFDTLLVLGPLIAGAVGTWRLAKPLGSPRAAIAATFAYALNPLPMSIIAAGRWQVLVVWGAAPFIVASALRLQCEAPFDRSAAGGPHRLSIRLLRFGLLVAAVATAAPMVVVLAVIVLVALAIGSVLIARPAGLRSLALGVPVALLTSLALHLPWSLQVITDGSWRWVIGPESANATFDSMADLVRFAPGLAGPGTLIVGVIIVAGMALIIAKSQRFDVAARGLSLAVVAWILAWAGRREYVPIEVPGADALLCLAAVGVALAVAAAVRALELDLGRRSSSVQSVLRGVVGLGLALVTLLGFQSALDGRWGMPTQSHIGFARLLLDGQPEPVRTLWIGASEVLPIDGADSPGGIHFGVSEGTDIDIVNRYAPATNEIDAEIGDRLDLVVDGQTDRVGRLLAAYGIDLVIVVPSLGPPPYDGPRYEPGNGIESVLSRQLDLQRVTGTLGLRVYRNAASAGAAQVVEGQPPPIEVADQLSAETGLRSRAPFRYGRTGHWVGLDPAVDEAYLIIDGEGWVAGNEGSSIVAFDDHHLQVQAGGDAVISARFGTSTVSRMLLVLQLLAIGVGIVLSQPEREEQP